MTANPLISLGLGAVITIAMQSSSASTVMLVGLVNSGIMHFSQTLNVIFGANIGTTLTAWLLSLTGIESDNIFLAMLKPDNFSPILALVGVFMLMLCKRDRNKSIGNILVGFAVLMIRHGLYVRRRGPPGRYARVRHPPGWSSSAIPARGRHRRRALHRPDPVLGRLGPVFSRPWPAPAPSPDGMAIPIIMGQNIGTCITAVLSCIGANTGAKRVAIMHTLINLLGTVIILPVYLILNAIFHLPIHNLPIDAFGIALCHTMFNIIATAILMPNGQADSSSSPSGSPGRRVPRPRRIPPLPSAHWTTVCCGLRRWRSARASTTPPRCARPPIRPCARRSICWTNTARIRPRLWWRKRISSTSTRTGWAPSWVRLSSRELSSGDSHAVSLMLHSIGDFERLGDHAVNIQKVAEEMWEKRLTFSQEARQELDVLLAAIEEILQLTEDAFTKRDLSIAVQVEPLEQVVDKLIAKIKDHHIDRLTRGECTIEMGFILSDLLNNCERVSDHCSNIAVALIEVEHNSFDTHKYLNDVKYGSADFAAAFAAFAGKYAL